MKPLPKFTAVIHVLNDTQAVEQTKLALSEGAGGVFLINHGASHNALISSYYHVRSKFPGAWIGLNFLDLWPMRGIERMPITADALWMDSITGTDLQDMLAGKPWRLFAGAAFKYQPHVGTDAQEAIFVAKRVRQDDVVTTSGEATGAPPTLEKIQEMHEALPYSKLAIASGITVGNAHIFAPFVNCFLVATGISRSFHELDPLKVRKLAEVVA